MKTARRLKEMGLAHKERLNTLNISWDHVVARLLP